MGEWPVNTKWATLLPYFIHHLLGGRHMSFRLGSGVAWVTSTLDKASIVRRNLHPQFCTPKNFALGSAAPVAPPTLCHCAYGTTWARACSGYRQCFTPEKRIFCYALYWTVRYTRTSHREQSFFYLIKVKHADFFFGGLSFNELCMYNEKRMQHFYMDIFLLCQRVAEVQIIWIIQSFTKCTSLIFMSRVLFR